ncbi:hypothetical protein [Krasilnikovia sp. MM14-A1259]|uniref:hypothetical protein n=1 Tax=Krasilnikovia sp. MM14-A1259 TaxID=3373539 RepID=UPI003803320C
MMPVLFVFVVGIAVALIRRHFLVAPEERPSGDAPARLLGWAVGLLAEQRQQWGQAMIGELDSLDGRARRWRFALGCVAAAAVMPPWGRAAAALGALMAIAASGGGLVAYTHMHYRLHTDGWTWVGAVILVLLLVGYILGGSVLLRRPGVTGPGLVGGLVVAAAWLAAGGFTFNRWLNSNGLGPSQWLLLLAPIVVGAGGTLWGGSAAVGRRAVRLATVSAALGIYLYGILAVAVVGATGHDPSDGWTTAQIVDDNLGNQAVFYLIALPLMTATIGWAAAAATARLRHRPAATAPAALPAPPGADPALTAALLPVVTASRPAPDDLRSPAGPNPAGVTAARQRRIWYVLVLCAALAAVTFLVLITFLHPR